MFLEFLKSEDTSQTSDIFARIEIQLDSKFPFKSSPRVYFLDIDHPIAKNLCNDCRDFLEDIIEQSWNPSIFLIDIILAISPFIVIFSFNIHVIVFRKKC